MHQVHVNEQTATGYSAIVEVLKAYYDGLYRCDSSLLAQVFHPSAQYFTASSGELLHLDMSTYFPIVEQRISPESLGEAYGFSIDSIEFVGDVTAIAHMSSSLFSKDFIDCLALIKIDGKWQIISKVFHYTAKTDTRSEQPTQLTESAGEITCPT
ncbi:MAG: nuclear transport factor 2 family protein [Cyanobacteria bacterium P01_D01_bin.115]